MYIYNNNICMQEREKIEEVDGEDDYIKMLLPILTKKEAAFMTASSFGDSDRTPLLLLRCISEKYCLF